MSLINRIPDSRLRGCVVMSFRGEAEKSCVQNDISTYFLETQTMPLEDPTQQ